MQVVRRFRASTITVSALVALVMGVTAPAGAAPLSQEDQVWIVQLSDGTHPGTQGRQIAAASGGHVRQVFDVINGYSFEGTAQEAARLARHPRVDLVEPNHSVHATADTVPTGVNRIDAEPIQGVGTGDAVTVAVIDTGIDLEHPDLSGNIHPTLSKDCVDWDSTSSADDDGGHGTHVAGTIAASANGSGVVGVAPSATLVPVKVLDSGGSGSWESVICGVQYVTNNASQIKVANMSLGGGGTAGSSCSSSGLRQAICTSVGAGVFYAVAAGNEADSASNHVPAAYPEVTTVSAMHDTNGLLDLFGSGPCESGGPPWARQCDDALADFSNHGSAVDVMAPGVSIYSTYPGGYATASGTSMASPHVAGVAALVRAADPGLSPVQIEALLQDTGECPNGETNGNTSGPCTGDGAWSFDTDGRAEPLVDADSAVGSLGTVTSPATNTAPVVDITSPGTGVGFDDTDSINFAATVTDEDAGLASNLAWSSNLDGQLHVGASFSTSTLSVGTHTVTASVTDSGDLRGSDSVTVTVSSTATPSGFSLSATGYKVKGFQHADLAWSGAGATSVDVYRSGVKVDTTANDGSYTDNINNKGGGSYTYKVCEAGTTTCSNESSVSF